MAKIVNFVYDEPLEASETQSAIESAEKHEDLGYTVYSEIKDNANPGAKSGLPRPKRPV